jgi:hypothetical protein
MSWRKIGIVSVGWMVLVAALSLASSASEEFDIWVNSTGNGDDMEVCLEEGSAVHVFIRVSTAVRDLTIWDMESTGDQVVLVTDQVPAGLRVGEPFSVGRGTVMGVGWETLVLQVVTTTGETMTTSRSFKISRDCDEEILFDDFSLCIAAVSVVPPPFDEMSSGDPELTLGIGGTAQGCNVSYHVGQQISIRYAIASGAPKRVSLRNVAPGIGSQLRALDQKTVSPGAVNTVPAVVTGGQGTGQLVLRADSGDEGMQACTCSMSVRPSRSFEEGFDAGRVTSPPWQNGHEGQAPWDIVSGGAHTGDRCATAGGLSDYGVASLCLGLSTDRAGTLTFWYRTSTEESYDWLKFFVGETQMDAWSGSNGWQEASYSLPAGTHDLCWVYEKDESQSWGQDRVWIDQVEFVSP